MAVATTCLSIVHDNGCAVDRRVSFDLTGEEMPKLNLPLTIASNNESVVWFRPEYSDSAPGDEVWVDCEEVPHEASQPLQRVWIVIHASTNDAGDGFSTDAVGVFSDPQTAQDGARVICKDCGDTNKIKIPAKLSRDSRWTRKEDNKFGTIGDQVWVEEHAVQTSFTYPLPS